MISLRSRFLLLNKPITNKIITCLKSGFATTQDSKPKSKKKDIFTDKHQLSKEEINTILRKPKSKPDILLGTPVERGDYKNEYEKSIEEKIGTARFQTVKQFNTMLEDSKKTALPEAVIRPSDRPDVKYYKYDLPIPNIDPEIEGLDDIFERERKKKVTVNQNVWGVLGLDKESDFNSYQVSLQKKFNFEMDMYGSVEDIEAKLDHQLKTLGEDAVPMTKINDQKYMTVLRECFTLNINMPGTLENEDPNKFIRNLRPIEEFRHTPLIPISEKQMADHKRKVEEYHRSGLFFEIKKDQVANWGLFAVFCFVAYNLLSWLMEKEEESEISYERIKFKRLTNA